MRRDGDRVVARFSPDGQLDSTFADAGVYSFDLSGLTDTARHGFVEPSGEIFSAGYARQPTGAGAQAENGVVLLRLTEAGAPAQGFGYKGVVNSNPFIPESPETQAWGMAEAYVARLQSGKYVTCGYGRDETVTSGKVDVVSFRYNADGTLDTTYGNRGDGTFTFDLIGQDERGRDMVVLPDGRLFMVGSGTPVAGNIDALTIIAAMNGQLDEGYGTQGYLLHDLGRSEEALYGVALSPGGLTVAAVGYGKQAGDDDDALVHLHSVAENEAVLTQLVPLSADGHDRLWAVTYAPDGTLYGAGYVEVDGDQRMAVARFTPAGALDPTFGDGGVITLNVTVAGPEEVRGLVVQSDGKIVVAGTAAH
jgi:uncharacterized delta-60 repeat protein